MKKLFLIFILCLGCANCNSPSQTTPNIRVMPFVEACPQACIVMDAQHLNCDPYNMPIAIDSEGGTWNCSDYLTYLNNNSIPMNCKCIGQITKCSQIDCASRVADCNNNIDKLCP